MLLLSLSLMPSYLYHTIDVISTPESWQREYVSMNSLMQAAKNTIMHVDPDYKSDVDLVATTHPHGLWIFSNRLQVEIDDIVVCPRYKMSHSEYIYYLLFIIYYLLFIIYYLLFIIYYLLFIIYYLLFIIYFRQFKATHHSNHYL